MRNTIFFLFLIVSLNAWPIIITRNQYEIDWNPITRNADKVRWTLHPSDTVGTMRQKEFKADPEYGNVLPTEYSGSCYDRGHMVPSADRQASNEDNKTTFYMTNILPQSAYLNRVLWESFESYLRSQITDDCYAIIEAGPIYGDFVAIGPNVDILVPNSFYKKVDWSCKRDSIMVVMPNIAMDGTTKLKSLCKDQKEKLKRKPNAWRDYIWGLTKNSL